MGTEHTNEGVHPVAATSTQTHTHNRHIATSPSVVDNSTLLNLNIYLTRASARSSSLGVVVGIVGGGEQTRTCVHARFQNEIDQDQDAGGEASILWDSIVREVAFCLNMCGSACLVCVVSLKWSC